MITRLLVVLLMFGAAWCQAQIPMRYAFKPLKGKVLKMETLTYSDVKLAENGKPILDGKPISRNILTFQDGTLKTMRTYSSYRGAPERLTSKVLFAYDSGRLMQVEEFNNITDSEAGNLLLGSTATPIYTDGQMVSEEVKDATGRLMTCYEYQKTASGLTTIDHFSYSGTTKVVGNRYGILTDSLGRALQFGTVGNDTFSLSRRVSGNDSTTVTYAYVASGGLKTPFSGRTWTDKDTNGNTTMTLEESKNEQGKITYSAYVLNYQYDGQPDFEAARSRTVTLENLVDGWFNRQDNIKFIIRAPKSIDTLSGVFECGDFFTTQPIEPNFPNYWITQLTSTPSGIWTYDTEKQLLELASAGSVIARVKLSFDGEILVLTPVSTSATTLRLIRRRK